MEKKDTGEELSKTLLKVALGFKVAEVTEEFAEVDGELKLTKRKRIKKDVPPDLKAVQLLLSESGAGISGLSDEELEKEKKRLLALLDENKESKKKKVVVRKNGKDSGQVLDEWENVKDKPSSTGAKKSTKKGVKSRAKPRKRVVKNQKGE